jgi:N12 class adenine-specific DNA methylase
MCVAEDTHVARYLDDLMAMVARATPGQLSIDRTPDRRYTLTTTTGQLVAVVNRRSDADVFARDRLDLRALVAGVAEVVGRHHDDGTGACEQDGQPMPCVTRRDLDLQLAPRAGSS